MHATDVALARIYADRVHRKRTGDWIFGLRRYQAEESIASHMPTCAEQRQLRSLVQEHLGDLALCDIGAHAACCEYQTAFMSAPYRVPALAKRVLAAAGAIGRKVRCLAASPRSLTYERA
jgi:hypothetical protein